MSDNKINLACKYISYENKEEMKSKIEAYETMREKQMKWGDEEHQSFVKSLIAFDSLVVYK